MNKFNFVNVSNQINIVGAFIKLYFEHTAEERGHQSEVQELF
jgi:hypothetical protein